MTIVAFAEKNTAAKQIATILGGGRFDSFSVAGVSGYRFTRNGKQWEIIGLSGHIMGYDYPVQYQKWNDVDPGVLLDTDPEKTVTKENFSKAVETLAKGAELIILACDYDREGENIGFEAKEIAETVSKAPVKRAKYSSFAENEIIRAFENPAEPDGPMAMAAEVRQILDLKMGAAFTRYVTLAVRQKAFVNGVLSIGPCQTPTCGFVYEREKLIRSFQAKDFRRITADFDFSGNVVSGTHRSGNIYEKEKADVIFAKIKNEKTAVVSGKTVKEQRQSPPSPLNTTEFLKRASSFLGIAAEQALELAEQLYLGGFTSYPRTETNKYTEDVNFGQIVTSLAGNPDYTKTAAEILSRPIVPKNGPKDAKDHPPIHPVKGALRTEIEKVVPAEGAYAVYDLICRHFLATLMPEAVFEKTRFELTIKDEIFDAAGSVMKEPGFLSVYNFETKKDKLLPAAEAGDQVIVKKVLNTASKTTPPKKLTEAELLTLMDKNGIGTKATAPSHIETNKKRGYFELKGKTISILDTGYMLMESLDSAVPVLVRPKVRAEIEALIQQVEDGQISFEEAKAKGTVRLKEMFADLVANREKLAFRMAGSIKSEAAEEDKKTYIGKCPDCGNAVRIVTTEKGRFVGCVGYPDCRRTYTLPKTGALTIQRSKICPKTGFPVIDVARKYSWSVGIGPCFNCDQQQICDPPEIAGLCPKCRTGNMILIRSGDNRFLACSEKCGYTQSVPKTGRLTILEKKCPVCGWNLFRNKETDKEAEEFCANRRCRAIAKRNAAKDPSEKTEMPEQPQQK
ncbi:topoisomerase DNA-binding C4 zinc finger domain-containing protein [Methanosarcinaceae archaeon]|nr:topoisomerase DNA-binding C4 zinc finger domain-containing protein [Methanosarcinaceae archaeon]